MRIFFLFFCFFVFLPAMATIRVVTVYPTILFTSRVNLIHNCCFVDPQSTITRSVTRLVCWLPFMTIYLAAKNPMDFLKTARATLNP